MLVSVASSSPHSLSESALTSASLSVWKSSPGTGQRPGLDRTITGKDRFFLGPIKTETTVQSAVLQYFVNRGPIKDQLGPVLTGLFPLVIVYNFCILNIYNTFKLNKFSLI